MQKENRFYMPQYITEDKILELFLKEICGQEDVWINGNPLLVAVNCRITDDTITDKMLSEYGFSKEEMKQRAKIIPETKGLYTQSPIIDINDMKQFKKALYDYVKAYTQTDITWTQPDMANDWETSALYTMLTIWTDATRQDFSNPVEFLKRYTAFLTQDQWKDLEQAQKVKKIGSLQVWKRVGVNIEERETPYRYELYATDANGKKYYFPAVCYGIQGEKAYVYAIHNIFGKPSQENEELQNFRRSIKGRGLEPLAIASMLAFLQEAKERGIKQVALPDNFIMQYTTKNKIQEQEIQSSLSLLQYTVYAKLKQCSLQGEMGIYNLRDAIMELAKHRKKEGDYERLGLDGKQEEIQKIVEETRKQYQREKRQKRREKEERLQENHQNSMNKRLTTLLYIDKYYTSGLKFLEIPGEVSDHYTVDIQNFKIGKEVKPKEDRRRKQKKIEIEEER